MLGKMTVEKEDKIKLKLEGWKGLSSKKPSEAASITKTNSVSVNSSSKPFILNA